VLLAGLLSCFPYAGEAQATAPIEITGLEGELLELARANITVAQELAMATSHRALNRRLRQAVAEIDNALRVHGYYSAVITPEIEGEGEQRRFRFVVEPGEPVRIDSVQLDFSGDGADFQAFQDWRAGYPLASGDVLVDTRYEEAKTELQRTARKYGFFDSEFLTREIRVDPDAGSADVLIAFDTGQRYRYGEVNIAEDYFDHDFLWRYFSIVPGQSFDNDDLQTIHRRLSSGNYFGSIRVTPQLEERDDGQVPVSVELQRRKRDRYFAGVGYSTDLGPRLKLGAERRYVNPRGHSLDGLVDYAELKRLAQINYVIPLTRPYSDRLVLSWQFNDRRDEDLKSRVNGVDATRIWKRGRHDWQYGIWWFGVQNRLDDTYTEGSFLAPTLGWTYTRADNLLFPRRALQLSTNLVGAVEAIASTESFLQAQFGARLVLPSFNLDRILLRGRLGRTLIDDFDVLPKQLRFYAGGDNSVRGYAYESLSPRNENGSYTGGNTLIFGSVEYEYFFRPEIAAAVFWDTGNAFNAGNPLQLAHGAGVGLHLNLPFGVFRFDVANALSKPDRPWRLHVTLRPDL